MTSLFLGYGSLLSARGLGAQLDSIVDVELATLHTARRFGKPPQKGGRIAMELACPTALLEASAGRPPARAEPGCGSLLLHVAPEGEAQLVRREGYPPAAWARLREAAEGQVAPFLARLAREAHDDPIAYRSELWRLTGPPRSGIVHYVPHPVSLEDGRPALTFVAPDPGQTGDPALPSCKEAFPELRPVGLGELYALGPRAIPDWEDAKQTHYVELCLLGLAHGVYLGDLFAEPLGSDHPALALLRGLPREALLAERAALRSVWGGEAEALARYERHLAPSLKEAWGWSGLAALAEGGNAVTQR